MNGDVMRTLEFYQTAMCELKAFLPTKTLITTEDDYVILWQDNYRPEWYIEIYFQGETYSQSQPDLYQALDAANDWWFHAQRGMLDV